MVDKPRWISSGTVPFPQGLGAPPSGKMGSRFVSLLKAFMFSWLPVVKQAMVLAKRAETEQDPVARAKILSKLLELKGKAKSKANKIQAVFVEVVGFLSKHRGQIQGSGFEYGRLLASVRFPTPDQVSKEQFSSEVITVLRRYNAKEAREILQGFMYGFPWSEEQKDSFAHLCFSLEGIFGSLKSKDDLASTLFQLVESVTGLDKEVLDLLATSVSESEKRRLDTAQKMVQISGYVESDKMSQNDWGLLITNWTDLLVADRYLATAWYKGTVGFQGRVISHVLYQVLDIMAQIQNQTHAVGGVDIEGLRALKMELQKLAGDHAKIYFARLRKELPEPVSSLFDETPSSEE